MSVMVDPDSDQYVYMQVYNVIKQRIGDGTYPRGRALPSARTLSQELEVSIGSVKHAVELLKSEGTVRTVIGRGVYVSS